MILLTVLLWTLVVLVGVLLLAVLGLLALPFEAEAVGAVADDDLDGRVRARFAWGLVSVRAETGRGVDIGVLGWRFRPGADDPRKRAKRAKKREERKERKARKRTEKRRAPRRRRSRGDFWRARGAILRAGGRIVRTLHLRGHIAGTVGLDDPADTAALVGVVRAVAANQRLLEVRIEPDWVDETIRIHGRWTARFRLAAFVWVALTALLDPPIWRALRGRRVANPPPSGGVRGGRRWST